MEILIVAIAIIALTHIWFLDDPKDENIANTNINDPSYNSLLDQNNKIKPYNSLLDQNNKIK